MLGWLIKVAADVVSFLLLARCILSWMRSSSTSSKALSVNHPVVQFIEGTTEPLLAPIRRVVPPVRYGYYRIDLSPMIAILLVQVAATVLRWVLFL